MESGLSRVTSGAPMATVEAQIEGIVAPSSQEPFSREFRDVRSIRLLADDIVQVVDVVSLAQVSPFQMSRAMSYPEGECRTQMLMKFEDDRKRW